MSFKLCTAVDNGDALKQQIFNSIMSGQLAEGDKLPTESELARMTGLCKSAVHGVITDLERGGIITVVPRHATYVADFRKTLTIDGLSMVLTYGSEHFDSHRHIITDAGMVESSVEESMIRLICEKEAPDLTAPLKILDQAQALLDRGNDDSEEYARLLTRELLALGSLTENYAFSAFLRTFCDAICVVAALWIREYGISNYVRSRQEIYRHIAASDSQGAVTALTASRAQFFLNK